jgi:hypothetical protein
MACAALFAVPLALGVLAAPVSGAAVAGMPPDAGPNWTGSGFVLTAAEQITAAAMNKAAKCHISSYSLSKSQAGLGTPIAMTTSSDGWCWTTPRTSAGGGFTGEVQVPPAHGQAVIVVDNDGLNRFAYKPQDGYSGPDHLKLSIYGGGGHRGTANYILDVTIDVQPK